MKKFVIIEIVDNQIDFQERVLVVKANPIRKPDGFDELNKMFGTSYYIYAEYEIDETNIFIIPFSEKILSNLLKLSQNKNENKFWIPNFFEFVKKRVRLNGDSNKLVWISNSIKEFCTTNYQYPYLYTHKKTLYAYKIINHCNEDYTDYADFSCIPYDGVPFTILDEVVRIDENDFGTLLHYIVGDRFCSIYGYEKNGLYSANYSHRIVFFKGLALECIIERFPKAVGAFTIIPEYSNECSFTFIITEEKLLTEIEVQSYPVDVYMHSGSSNLINLRRTDILLFMFSTYYGYSIKELSNYFDWNIFKEKQINSLDEQDILNYLYPKNYLSIYSEEEICYQEFINNCICISNVNNYNYGVDDDTINKNYNRVLNYIRAFPSFLNKIPYKYASYIAKAFYYVTQHFDDIRINCYLFIVAYYILSKTIETTGLSYLYYLRCSLVREKTNEAISQFRILFQNISSDDIEKMIDDILIADYINLQKYALDNIIDRDEVLQYCKSLMKKKYSNMTNQQIYLYVSESQEYVIHEIYHYINTPQFMTSAQL